METKAQIFYGKITSINDNERFVDAILMFFGQVNENKWLAKQGCLDGFLARINKAKKFIPACYQHDENNIIGQWRDLEITGDVLKGRLYLDNIPFVNDVVIPQLKSGTLQGASPSLAPIRDAWDDLNHAWEIIEAAACEFSLVGLPAFLKADILTVQAKIQSQNKDDFDFDLLTL